MVMLMNLNYPEDGEQDVTLTIDGEALGVGSDFAVYDLESQPALAKHNENLRKVAALRKTDREDPQIKKLTMHGRNVMNRVSLDLSKMDKLSEGPKVKLTVGPRDYVVLLVEPK
jgi:hypothetical protein